MSGENSIAAEANLAAMFGERVAEPTPEESGNPEDALSRMFEPAAPSTSAKPAHQERWTETNGQLKRSVASLEGQVEALTGQRDRATRVMYAALGVAGLSLVLAGASYLYTKGQVPRALESAFRIIHYREKKALSANALVLDDWLKKIESLSAEVSTKEGIPEEERQDRLKTLGGFKAQAQALRDGFVRQLEASEKETSIGGGFSYRDPYLRKEIEFSDESGGKIDLEALKNEIKTAANLDATMKSLRDAMLDPIPLSEQVRRQAEADKKDGQLPTMDLTKGLAGQGPSKLNGLNLPGKQ